MRYHTLALSSVWFRKTNKNKRVDRDYTSSGNGGFDTRDVDALYGVVDRLSFSATFFLCVCPLYPSDRQTLIVVLDVFGSVNTSLRHIQYLTIMTLYSLSVILWHKLSLRNVDFGCGNTNVELDWVFREYCETSCIASYVSCSDTQ